MLCDTYLGHNVTHILKSESSTVQQEETDALEVTSCMLLKDRFVQDDQELMPCISSQHTVLYVRQNYLFCLELTAILAYH